MLRLFLREQRTRRRPRSFDARLNVERMGESFRFSYLVIFSTEAQARAFVNRFIRFESQNGLDDSIYNEREEGYKHPEHLSKALSELSEDISLLVLPLTAESGRLSHIGMGYECMDRYTTDAVHSFGMNEKNNHVRTVGFDFHAAHTYLARFATAIVQANQQIKEDLDARMASALGN